ncbi:Stk1 family PASTA domain-containing Ser/Thr kinase [Kribbella sp. NBC_01245]|uniref:Stk1 family PASTA domain-containing Ser/Thr kinase n=1 Tax=Kribbella sp. NBC_01245 TaxID=2903578 RepID=UPI002E27F202|nr:Stk1 family PASTA domain-containing Ser/Thr kinase [Kribbella sp. NBC_01245]
MNSQARLVGGRYEEGDPLGRGGMADVRKGVDNRLGRTVAIKRLRVDLASDSTFQARFRREAQSAASLNHPTIVSVYDTGEEPDPNGSGITIPYIVMEYVAGKTLRDLIREGRKIMPERALELTSGVLEALDYSHRAGIVHRDIKPGNVMITPQGQVKVMDFGIARAIADTSSTMTQTAAVIGTAQYLSPEQARGETVDARSDLYSTGCLLYELLTGRPPFVGESPVSVAYQHVREEPLPPSSFDPEIPPEIDAVVLKALTKNRDHRYQSANEMRQDIHRVLAGQQVTAPMAPVGASAETRAIPAATMVAPGAGGPGTGLGGPRPGNDLMGPDDRDPMSAAARRNRGLAFFLLGLAIVAVAIGGYLVYKNANDGKAGGGTTPDPSGTTSQVAQVKVPSLITMTIPQATKALSDLGLTVGTTTAVANSSFKVGTVMSQDPIATTLVEPNTPVNLTYSAGEQTYSVPDVIGNMEEEARTKIENVPNANFNVKVEQKDAADKKGTVLDVSPDTSKRYKGGTTFTLTVSTGAVKVDVPSVVGDSQEQAEKKLREAGLVPVAEEQESADVEAGKVISQTPADGQATRGSQVKIYIAVEPEGEPSPTPTPTGPGITITPPGGGTGWGRGNGSGEE